MVWGVWHTCVCVRNMCRHTVMLTEVLHPTCGPALTGHRALRAVKQEAGKQQENEGQEPEIVTTAAGKDELAASGANDTGNVPAPAS